MYLHYYFLYQQQVVKRLNWIYWEKLNKYSYVIFSSSLYDVIFLLEEKANTNLIDFCKSLRWYPIIKFRASKISLNCPTNQSGSFCIDAIIFCATNTLLSEVVFYKSFLLNYTCLYVKHQQFNISTRWPYHQKVENTANTTILSNLKSHQNT